MTFKDLLLYLDDEQGSARALDFAALLAAQHQAHLTALHTFDVPLPSLISIPEETALGISTREAELLRQAALARAGSLHLAFEEVIRREAVVGEWRQIEASAHAVAPLHARYADLVIFGRSYTDEGRWAGSSLVETVLFRAGRPVLVVPPYWQGTEAPRRILVGWSGSRASARALHDAMPLLRACTMVTVLAICAAEELAAGRVNVEDAARHLARHGVPVTGDVVCAEGIDTARLLLNRIAENGHDGLVIGGYDHSTTRELVFGGVTREMLQHASVPLLLSH